VRLPAFRIGFRDGAHASSINAGVISILTPRRFSNAAQRTSSISYRYAKRAIDILLCALAVPFLVPLFCIVALAVRLSSPGPIFYREQRVGRGGRPFTIFKFRSMHTKEYLRDVLGYRVCEESILRRRLHEKREDDRRITRVGLFLRRSSLDEFPQLLNVLRGEMSLIGPRPVVQAELDEYGDSAEYYTLVFPGITGLWQVSGRNDVSYERRIRMDVAYCKGWNPLLDARILLLTVPAVLRGKGAY
jgi:lipopolysaccharide/colanic/teichoic acid biosynthesis glycosyltransferase